MSSRQTHLNHVILVDDDSDDRELFAEAVSIVNPSIDIRLMRDGEELIGHLKGGYTRPDVVFLDLNMPRKSGKECLIELMREECWRDIPVVIYSTSMNPSDVEDTYRQGASRFVKKPNSFEELTNVLRQLLGKDFFCIYRVTARTMLFRVSCIR